MDNPRTMGLLKKYAEKPVTHFAQFDGFVIPEDSHDSVMQPDEQGHWICSTETVELMSGNPEVRVLINDNAVAVDVINILRKMANWIEQDGIHVRQTTEEI